MATARKLPSGNWRIQQYVGMEGDKRQYKSFTAATKKEAEFAAAEYMMEKRRKEAPENMTVGEAIDRYIENRENVLSPSTVSAYKRYARIYYDDLRLLLLGNLTNDLIQRYVNKLSNEQSSKTVRNAYGLLSSVLREFHPDLRSGAKLPQRKKPKVSIPADDDIVCLIQAAKGTYLEAVIILGACVGLRRSEICALTRDDIDLARGLINVDKAIVVSPNGGWVMKATKTYAGTRTIQMPISILERLLVLALDRERIVPVTPRRASMAFQELRTKHGYTFRLHDLRHYKASVMLALGVPDKYAMEVMGHATPNMLKNVYQHVMADRMTAFSDMIAKHAEAIVRQDMQHDLQHETLET